MVNQCFNVLILLFRAFTTQSEERRNEHRFLLAAAIAKKLGGFRLYKHSHTWYRDTDYLNIWKRFPEARSTAPIKDKQWAIWQLARSVSGLQGDTAECGVYRGAGSFLILAATEGQSRMHHVFDSFEGLSTPVNVDLPVDPKAHRWQKGELGASLELVQKNLSQFSSRVRFHRGWIPTRFSDVGAESFSFVYIDVDLYQPTLDSLKFFYPRTVKGGLLVCDDYGFIDCPGARKAVDEFLADKPERVIHLTSGQGVVIKR